MEKSGWYQDAENLRKQAEERLIQKNKDKEFPPEEIEMLRLLHELEVHEVELELQNEELQIAKAAAQKAAYNYIELFDFAPVGYFVITDQGKIADINLHGAKMLGKDRILLNGTNLILFISEDSRPVFSQFIARTFRRKTKETCEVMLNNPQKTPVFVRLTGQVTSGSGQCHLIGIEITDIKVAEAELNLKNLELNNINAEKDILFSILAHDLRTPFNAILGFTQILVEEIDTFSKEEIRHFAETMRKSAVNAFVLLENLLEWTRMQRGLITCTPTAVELCKLTEKTTEIVKEAVAKKNLVLSIEIPANLMVHSDPDILQIVIRNLVSNAVKFTPRNGVITLSAHSTPDKLVLFSVTDNGIGMNSEMIDKLFRFDDHAGRKGTDGEPSSGLGLIICRGLVEKQGGKIWMKSNEGVGTTFCFTIPEGL